MPDLSGRIVIVTGANSGVGFYTALELANKHAHVILACRNKERGLRAQQEIREETGNTDVEFMQVDMGSGESIRAFATAFHQRFDRLDLLVNNAGFWGAPYKTTPDGFEAHFGTNYLGAFYLTSLLFDLLKASKAARVVNLSSLAHRAGSTDFKTVGYYPADGQTAMKAYSISKLAMNLFAFELDRRLRAAGLQQVKAIAVHPGTSVTPGMQLPSWLETVVRPLSSCVFNSQEASAWPSLFAATEESIEGGEFIGPSGFLAMKGPPARATASKQSYSLEDAANLWARSEELLQCRFEVK